MRIANSKRGQSFVGTLGALLMIGILGAAVSKLSITGLSSATQLEDSLLLARLRHQTSFLLNSQPLCSRGLRTATGGAPVFLTPTGSPVSNLGKLAFYSEVDEAADLTRVFLIQGQKLNRRMTVSRVALVPRAEIQPPPGPLPPNRQISAAIQVEVQRSGLPSVRWEQIFFVETNRATDALVRCIGPDESPSTPPPQTDDLCQILTGNPCPAPAPPSPPLSVNCPLGQFATRIWNGGEAEADLGCGAMPPPLPVTPPQYRAHTACDNAGRSTVYSSCTIAPAIRDNCNLDQRGLGGQPCWLISCLKLRGADAGFYGCANTRIK